MTTGALAGCSGDDVAGPVAIDITIDQGTMTPNGDRVEVVKGSVVTVSVTSDVDVLIHVHGYEKEINATAGKRAEVKFTADMVGSFEIETHDPARVVAQLVVR